MPDTDGPDPDRDDQDRDPDRDHSEHEGGALDDGDAHDVRGAEATDGGVEDYESFLRRWVRRIRRTRWAYAFNDGTYGLAIPDAFIEVIEQQVALVRGLLMSDADDPNLRPLFPAAYDQDPELDAEYQRLMRSELLSSRLAAFDTVEQTMHKDALTESELYQWMQSINAVRLAVAERNGFNLEEEIDITPDDPRFYDFEVLEYLGVLLGDIIGALRAGGSVDDAGRE